MPDGAAFPDFDTVEGEGRCLSAAELRRRRLEVEVLIIKDYDWIKRTAYKIAHRGADGAAGEDLAQSAIEAMLRRSNSWIGNDEGSIRPWATTIMRNIWISDIRKAAHRPCVDIDDENNRDLLPDGPSNAQEMSLLMSEFCEKMLQLPPQRYQKFLSYILNGGDYAMAAAEIDTSLGHLKSSVHHSRMSLSNQDLSPGSPKKISGYDEQNLNLGQKYVKMNLIMLQQMTSKERDPGVPPRRGLHARKVEMADV